MHFVVAGWLEYPSDSKGYASGVLFLVVLTKLDRSRRKDQMKHVTLAMQVEGWAQGQQP